MQNASSVGPSPLVFLLYVDVHPFCVCPSVYDVSVVTEKTTATLRGNFFALMGHGGLDSEHSGIEPH